MQNGPAPDKRRWSLWRMEQAEYCAGEPSNVVYGHIDMYDTDPQNWDMSEVHGVTPLSEISDKGKHYAADYEPRITEYRQPSKVKKEREKVNREQLEYSRSDKKGNSRLEEIRIYNNNYIAGFKSDSDERKEEELKARRNKYLVEW